MGKSKIEWCTHTWNPVIGCSRVTEGCRNCYAERMALRHASNPKTPQYHGLTKGGKWTGSARFLPERLDQPSRWRKPSKVFVCSMSDLFHESIGAPAIYLILDAMARESRHTFQVLTKRPQRMRLILEPWRNGLVEPPPNVWFGVSVHDQASADYAIPLLLQTPAAVRWVSYEPALGPVDFSVYLPMERPTIPDASPIRWLDWLVMGGESGPSARPMHPQWARDVRDQCRASGTPFMFKQWGRWMPQSQHQGSEWLVDRYEQNYLDPITCEKTYRVGKRKAGRLLDGVLHDEYPEVTK